MGEYELLRRRAGVFGLVSDLDCSAGEVYGRYKEREEVELCFDVLKNELETDRLICVVWRLFGVILLWFFWLCGYVLRFWLGFGNGGWLRRCLFGGFV